MHSPTVYRTDFDLLYGISARQPHFLQLYLRNAKKEKILPEFREYYLSKINKLEREAKNKKFVLVAIMIHTVGYKLSLLLFVHNVRRAWKTTEVSMRAWYNKIRLNQVAVIINTLFRSLFQKRFEDEIRDDVLLRCLQT